MKILLDLIKNKIKESNNEFFNNFIFCIKHKDENIKRKIKECLIQGDDKLNHTIIEIDFIKDKPKSTKKERIKRKMENILNKNKINNIEDKQISDNAHISVNNISVNNIEDNNIEDNNISVNNIEDNNISVNNIEKQFNLLNEHISVNNIEDKQISVNNISVNNIENNNINDNIPNIKIYNNPIYICGRYIKLNRIMSQTPLIINNVLKTNHSISDFIEEFKTFYLADSVKFLASGREDIDVKCIQGRPFVLEIISPKRHLDATSMDIELYDTINIVDTFITTKICKELINKDVSDKHYLLAVYSEKPILLEKIYNLNQKTPLRVLHRRSNDTRIKTIEVIEYKDFVLNEGYYYEIFIKASSGTYIKEWVNGDFGRTTPNLNSDLLELDVYSVDKKFTSDILKKSLI